MRSQVFTLTQSLSTMSAEKEKIIATYRAEKKKLKVCLKVLFVSMAESIVSDL